MIKQAEALETYSIKDASERLGVSPKTIRRWIDRLEIQKTYTSSSRGGFAKIVLDVETVDKIAAALGVQGVQHGTEARTNPGVQVDNTLDIPPQMTPDTEKAWTSTGQTNGHPWTVALPLDSKEELENLLISAFTKALETAQERVSEKETATESGRVGKWLEKTTYCVLIVSMGAALWVALSLAQRINAMG